MHEERFIRVRVPFIGFMPTPCGHANNNRQTNIANRTPRIAANVIVDLVESRQAEAIGDVRGLGLYIGVEIVSDPDQRLPDAKLAKALVEDAKRQGVLLNTNGYDNNIIKIKPPLIIDARDIDRLLSVFARSLNALALKSVAA